MFTILTTIIITIFILSLVIILYPIVMDRINKANKMDAATTSSSLPSLQKRKYDPFDSIPDPTEAPTFRVFRILNCNGDEQFIILSKGFDGTEFAADRSDIANLAKFFGINESSDRSYILENTEMDFDDNDLDLSFQDIVAYSNFRFAFDTAQLLTEMQLAATWHIDPDFDPSAH